MKRVFGAIIGLFFFFILFAVTPAEAFVLDPIQGVDTRRDDRWLEVFFRMYPQNNRPTQFNGNRNGDPTGGILHSLGLRGQANLLRNQYFRLDGYMDFMVGTHWDIFDIVRDTEQIKVTSEWRYLKGLGFDIGRQGNGNVGTGNPPRQGSQPGMTFYWLGLSYQIYSEPSRRLEVYGRHYFETGQAGMITERYGVPNTSAQLLSKEIGVNFHQMLFGEKASVQVMPYMYFSNSMSPQLLGGYVIGDYAIGSLWKWANPATYGLKGKLLAEVGYNYNRNTSYTLTNGGPNFESILWAGLKWRF